MGFTEIIRLELMDELMAQPYFNPLNHNVGSPIFNLGNNSAVNEQLDEVDENKAELNDENGCNVDAKQLLKTWRKNKRRSQKISSDFKETEK